MHPLHPVTATIAEQSTPGHRRRQNADGRCRPTPFRDGTRRRRIVRGDEAVSGISGVQGGAASYCVTRRAGSGLLGASRGSALARIHLTSGTHLDAQLTGQGEHQILGGRAYRLHIAIAAAFKLLQQLLHENFRH